MVKVVPWSGALVRSTVPWCARTRSATRASPMPAPTPVVACGARWNRSNTLVCSSAAIPRPVSVTVNTTVASSARRSMSMPPCGVYFTALDSRLVTMVDHMARSARAVTGSSGRWTRKCRPACSAGERNMLATSAVTPARSMGCRSGARMPASAPEKSSSASTMVRNRSAARIAACRSACSGAARSGAAASRSCSGVISRVSGVRSSWLTFWKNSILARSRSVSSCTRCRSCW